MSEEPSIERGVTYSAPEGEDPDACARWFRDRLMQAEKQWLPPVVVTLTLEAGVSVTGRLEHIDQVLDPNGIVYLEESGDSDELDPVPCTHIVAFRVAGAPPVDHSDELGRG